MTDLDLLRKALAVIPPDIATHDPRNEWNQVGIAAISAGLAAGDVHAWCEKYCKRSDVDATFCRVQSGSASEAGAATLLNFARKYEPGFETEQPKAVERDYSPSIIPAGTEPLPPTREPDAPMPAAANADDGTATTPHETTNLERAAIRRPAFFFYPADWRKDTELSSCSLAARGLWIEMMCIAHESTEYGVLSIKGKPMTVHQIARIVGESSRLVQRNLNELESYDVFSRRTDGAIFSRRMVRDEQLRNIKRDGGKQGAAHGIKGKEFGVLGGRPRGDKKPPIEPPIETPITYAVTDSTSLKAKSKTIRASALLAALGIPEKLAADFIELRKSKRAAITQTALEGIQHEAGKAGISLEAALRMCCKRGWASFEAVWLDNKNGKPNSVQQARLTVAQQIMGDSNETTRAIIDITPTPAIESH